MKKTQKEMRIEREAAALKKNLEKRKAQVQAREKASREAGEAKEPQEEEERY